MRSQPAPDPAPPAAAPPLRACEAGLIACSICGTVSRAEPEGMPPGAEARCPTCATPLEARRPDSLARTWALLLAAAILYIPATTLPIMVRSSLWGNGQETIMGGVVYFWTSGSQGLAILIFSVSILIPLLKMASLAVLAASVSLGRPGTRWRMGLYRLIEFIGRWSMLDVFVVALMVALVRFRTVAEIEAGPAAAAFGAVVVLTMLATHAFDPRLMWDKPGSSSR
ncbi:paraquat-inducible protein A [Pararhodospirillum oryzae]|nr:paraquat-inducible protein A [Pararhodospirillum oryzae]